MKKIVYKCCVCNKILDNRDDMRRLVVQTWNSKGYGRFANHKNFDLCLGCYKDTLKFMTNHKTF